MNTVFVSTYRRPYVTRLCLEALARAHRWCAWADRIFVCIAPHGNPTVRAESESVLHRNPDIPFVIATEPRPMNPHEVSKWMLDFGFDIGCEAVLYVEDDAILAPDAFMMLEFASRERHDQTACVCLYHETILEHYPGSKPDPRLLHYGNGINTLGGTAFFRDWYQKVLGPNWNSKEVEPRGFDYSCHYLMYVHQLYAVWPDLSRSVNLGFELGNSTLAFWQQYCGRSQWTQTNQAVRNWRDFVLDEPLPPPVCEKWMLPELQHRGLLYTEKRGL